MLKKIVVFPFGLFSFVGIPVLKITMFIMSISARFLMPFSKGQFSLDVSSPRGPGRADGLKLSQNAMQHDISCVIYFWRELKIALTGVRSRVRKSLAKQLF